MSDEIESSKQFQMHPIVIDEDLFAGFAKHLSASLNVVDVLYTLKLLNADVDLNQDDPIVLGVGPAIIPPLIELQYPEFILACVRNFRLLESCRDVFCSEIETDMVQLFDGALEHVTQMARIEIVEQGFKLHIPARISGLLLPPIGRVHDELTRNYEYFAEMVDAVGGNTSKLFLNAKSPTPESQYLQIWVAAKLGVALNPDMGIVAVA
jgi:hypothetical protein